MKYRVIEDLGQQGDSVVYQAEDTELKRSVAIRVLPQDVALKADRRARRQRGIQIGLLVIALAAVAIESGLGLSMGAISRRRRKFHSQGRV